MDFPAGPAYTLGPGRPTPGPPILLRPPIAHNELRWYRNIDLFPIDYAFRPRLRTRLTLGRLTLPRKPWAYGEWVSHPFYRYSCQHAHFPEVHQSLRSGFNPLRTLPYRVKGPKTIHTRGFGSVLEPRYIFRAGPLDQ